MKVLIIKNIPSPYRNKLFNTVTKVLLGIGSKLEVWYLATREPNRKWDLSEKDFEYKHKYFWGIHPKISNMFAHFNPGVYWKLLKSDADIIIVGGFGAPTLWFIPFFVKKSSKLILWVETNNNRSLRNEGLAHFFKCWLISKYKFFIVPGERAKEYLLNRHKNVNSIHFVTLPNLIDENAFSNQVKDLRENSLKILFEKYKIDNSKNKQIWFCPARLSPEKGLLEFMKCLPFNSEKYIFLIAGDGPIENKIKDFVESNKLPVVLLGNRQIDEIVELYAISNLFVLPSLADASPLSVIEALAAKLPILVSDRIGNFPEVYNQENGWALNPENPENLKNTIKTIIECTSEKLAEKGKKSFELYNNNFNTSNKVVDFVNQLKKLNN